MGIKLTIFPYQCPFLQRGLRTQLQLHSHPVVPTRNPEKDMKLIFITLYEVKLFLKNLCASNMKKKISYKFQTYDTSSNEDHIFRNFLER